MQRNAAWAAAIAIGTASLGLQLAPAALVPAASCPGLLERTAIGIAQIARDAPLGLWLVRADRACFFLAIVVFARAARAASGSWLAAAGVALAFGASAIFTPSMSPFDPLVALAAALAAFALLRGDGDDGIIGWLGVLAVVVIAAAIPRATLPILAASLLGPVLATAGRRQHRSVLAAGAALAILLVAPLLVRSMPALPSTLAEGHAANCLLPSPGVLLSQFHTTLSSLTALVGPYALMLAVVGLYRSRRFLTDRRVGMIALWIVAAGVAAVTRDASTGRALVPVVIVAWLLAASGLAEVIRAAGSSVGGRIGAVLLVALVALVPMAARYRATGSTPLAASAFGHDRMTLDGIRRVLQLLPQRSVVVAEDAVTDVLLRAAGSTWQRSGKALRVVDAQPSSVAAAVAEHAWQVFALPASQRDLSELGFEMSGGVLPGVSGLALVESRTACLSIGEAWKAVEFTSDASTLVLVSERPAEEGAVAIWFGSDRPIGLAPLDWPAWAVPGFLPSAYSAQDHAHAERDAVDDQLTGREPVFEQPYLVRLEVWKPPNAPRLLAIAVGADRPAAGLIHATPGVTMRLCPGYAHTVQSIAFPRATS